MKTTLHKRVVATIIATALLALGNADVAQTFSDNEVRIGVFSDLSSPGSLLAAQTAIDDFKASAKPGFAVKLLSADHQNKADIASAKARSWFDQDGVDIIADLPSSAVALAVVKLAKGKNRLVIVACGASASITNEECTPTALHWVYDTFSLASGTARAVVKQGGDTWFFITADYAGGKALERIRHPFPGSDFSSYLLQAQVSGAKVIGLANAGNDTTNTIRQAVEFAITKKQSLAATLMFITDVHSLGLAKA